MGVRNRIALFLVARFLTPCVASQAFKWRFEGNLTATEIPECQTLSIVVSSISTDPNALGVPPYYMLALEQGGVPTTQNVGNNPGNLSWVVDHVAGSSLMLTMVDSNSSTGGILESYYNITSGATETCHSTPNQANLATIVPNVTNSLETCQLWGLKITGGQKPYTVVISSLGATLTTNVTMGINDDVLTWPNRASPNGEVMASVVDQSGQWGVSTRSIHTRGGDDVSCPGLITSSHISAETTTETNTSDGRTRRLLKIILGTILPVIFVTIIAGNVQDTTPRAFLPTSTTVARAERQVEEIGAIGPSVSKLSRLGSSSSNPSSLPLVGSHNDSLTPPDSETAEDGPASLTPPVSRARMDSQQHGLSSQGSKPSLRSRTNNNPVLSPTTSPASPSTSGNGLPQTSISTSTFDPDIQPDIIIQHRDGGSGIVQELPPPYVDRNRPSPA
ncbi:hypothetical protein NLI96_g8529 [Meripilus lineatus]|uniref:Uncharacterized protein n=1 Tax=Meripilus lineatus TaxID=2056292 RepID=A0AAD5UYX2_9APHY|nr:hypothetical protein NLI96_g8529 [Physisporinus lineatus]